jgi:hypothetical protein
VDRSDGSATLSPQSARASWLQLGARGVCEAHTLRMLARGGPPPLVHPATRGVTDVQMQLPYVLLTPLEDYQQ